MNSPITHVIKHIRWPIPIILWFINQKTIKIAAVQWNYNIVTGVEDKGDFNAV